MTAEELARRLITLIFAGRNRMDMIRRELPRTKNADGSEDRTRIERRRIFLSVSSRPAACAASATIGLNPAKRPNN